MTSLSAYTTDTTSNPLLSNLGAVQNEPSNASIKLENKRIKQNQCFRLLNASNAHPRNSNEIKNIVRLIAEEPASKKNNKIMDQLIYGHYSKKTLPKHCIQYDLEQAGLIELARKIGEMRFTDPALLPPRGVREGDYRLHEYRSTEIRT